MKSAAALVIALAGCQTTLDPNYALQLESYRLAISGQQNIEIARARAEEARYNAMAAIAERADAQTKSMAIFALALSRGEGVIAKTESVMLPKIPETQEDRALKWASVFAGPTTALISSYFGYQLGKTQSNNQAETTQASYAALVAFKPQPLDWSKLPGSTTTTTTTNTNITSEVTNRDGLVVVGGDGTQRPEVVPPVVVVPPVFPPVVVVPAVGGPVFGP